MTRFFSQALRHYLLSVQFFTRIPVTGALAAWVGYSPTLLRASAGHFPGVGALVGALVAAFSVLLWRALPAHGATALVVAALGTALGVLITGAFHEDGLADVADGLGGSQERARALEIMKDSRVGAFGAIAVLLVLLSKVASLALLGQVSAVLMVLALLAAHVVSRTWPLLTIRLLVHVGDTAQSKSKPLAEQISGAALVTGFIWCFMVLALAMSTQTAIYKIAFGGVSDDAGGAPAGAWLGAVLSSGLVWAGLARWFKRRLGGFTGDCLGATQQLCELAFYLGLALACGGGR